MKTKISHSEKELKEKSQQLLSKREEAVAAENELCTRNKDVERVQKTLESLPYEDGKMAALQKVCISNAGYATYSTSKSGQKFYHML